jgi:hypothetical protein
MRGARVLAWQRFSPWSDGLTTHVTKGKAGLLCVGDVGAFPVEKVRLSKSVAP